MAAPTATGYSKLWEAARELLFKTNMQIAGNRPLGLSWWIILIGQNNSYCFFRNTIIKPFYIFLQSSHHIHSGYYIIHNSYQTLSAKALSYVPKYITKQFLPKRQKVIAASSQLDRYHKLWFHSVSNCLNKRKMRKIAWFGVLSIGVIA
jgi:hypothetical protein